MSFVLPVLLVLLPLKLIIKWHEVQVRAKSKVDSSETSKTRETTIHHWRSIAYAAALFMSVGDSCGQSIEIPVIKLNCFRQSASGGKMYTYGRPIMTIGS